MKRKLTIVLSVDNDDVVGAEVNLFGELLKLINKTKGIEYIAGSWSDVMQDRDDMREKLKEMRKEGVK